MPVIIPEEYNDFQMFRGVDFNQDIQLVDDATGIPIDLTNCNVKCEVRDKQEQTGALLVEMVCTPTAPLTGDVNLFVERANIPNKKTGYYSVVVTDTNDLDSVYLLGSISISGISTVIV
jgi:hypothetical protein